MAAVSAETEIEEERIHRLKGKAIATDAHCSGDKVTHLKALAQRSTTLTIAEKPSKTTQQNSRQDQRYHLSIMEHSGKPLELEDGLEHDIDVPLTELESAAVDNLVIETERLEMEENMIDFDNDDLLGDIPDHDAEQIEAISQLSPANAVISDAHTQPIPHENTNAKIKHHAPVPKTQPGPYAPRGLLKKKTPRSPDIKGSNASKKLQALNIKTSPKKKTTSGKRHTSSSNMVPRTEVFPSALSKKYVSLSGSVVSQKPPSKKI